MHQKMKQQHRASLIGNQGPPITNLVNGAMVERSIKAEPSLAKTSATSFVNSMAKYNHVHGLYLTDIMVSLWYYIIVYTTC